ncbi:MAG: hypothetical protein KUG75_12860, partial [Pseudomonadales bacterium]|nr:hypothetical protein [Pseudomonadales bacterium]
MKNLQKHKICILVPTHWEHTMGGAQYQAKLLVEHLLKLGRFEVHYLASRIHPTFIPEAYELHKIGNSEGSGSLMDTVGLLRTLNQIKPATIYQHVGCANTGVAAYYCKKNQCKLVWHIASDWDVEPWDPPLSKYFSSDFLNRKTFEYGLKNADCIVGQTKLQGRLLYKNYGRNLTKLVRNFHPIPRESINKSGQIQILWIANIKKVKQPELF